METKWEKKRDKKFQKGQNGNKVHGPQGGTRMGTKAPEPQSGTRMGPKV